MLTEAQLSARRGKVTSSTAAAVLQRHPYMSPLMAWQAIMGKAAPDRFGDGALRALRRGDRLEDRCLDEAADLMGWTWEHCDTVSRPDMPWASDTCDAVYYADGLDEPVALGEAKTVGLGSADQWGAPMTAAVPRHVLLQVQWHFLHHPNIDLCLVPVLFGGYDFSFKIYRVPRMPKMCAWMVERCAAWHAQYVARDTPPPPTRLDNDLLTQTYPRADDADVVECDAELEALAELKATIREQRKALDAQEAEAEAKIKARLATHSGARSPRYSITWRNNPDRTFVDWQALAMFLGATPAQIHEHTRTKPGPRVLRVTKLKGASQ